MADSKLTALSAIGTLGDDDLFYVVDDPGGTPQSRKVTAANLAAYIKAEIGGITQIGSTLTLTSGSTAGWTSIPATYDYLVIFVSGVSLSGAGRVYFRASTNNGSSYDSTTGNYFKSGVDTGGTPFADPGVASLAWDVNMTGTSAVCNYLLVIKNYHAGPWTKVDFLSELNAGTGHIGQCYYKSTSAIDALRIEASAGSFDAGSGYLYGVS